MNSPQQLQTLDTVQFRQMLAGLVDPHDALPDDRRQEIKDLAIRFAGTLPQLYGEGLDRLAMWDRIATGLESAFAKTALDDHEFFVSDVLQHIKASASASSCNADLSDMLAILGTFSSTDRQAWLLYFRTHLIPILVHARKVWDGTKATRKSHRTGAAE